MPRGVAFAVASFAAVASSYSLGPVAPLAHPSVNVRMCTPADQPLPTTTSNNKLPGRPKARSMAATFALCAAGLIGGAPASDIAAQPDAASRGVLSRLVGARPAWAAQVLEAPTVRRLGAGAQKRLKLQLKTKLGKVPVFMVTNEGGSPFLNRLASGDQSALMFLFPAEAQKMLDGVLKAPNGASSGAKVLATNLDRAFKLARLDPSPSGLRDQYTNRDLTMVWQFMPHAAEQRSAQLLLAKTGKLQAPQVPAYMVEGLTLTKRGKQVRPVFLSKKDVDSALAFLAEQGEQGKIVVYDALGMIMQISRDIEAGDPDIEEELNTLEFVPASDSIDFQTQLKKERPKLKAKIVPPSHY